jgi:hypothetical protein
MGHGQFIDISKILLRNAGGELPPVFRPTATRQQSLEPVAGKIRNIVLYQIHMPSKGFRQFFLRSHSALAQLHHRQANARLIPRRPTHIWLSLHQHPSIRLTAGQDVESLITFEARPCSGESNAAIVVGAWDFDRINTLYTKCLVILEQMPEQRPSTQRSAGPLHRWARAEHGAWLDAVSCDPLLPRPLLPDAYLGQRAWKRRQECLAQAARLLGE